MRNERSAGPDPIDALIDDAARRMMAGGPSASLRGAVRERIEQRGWPWGLSPALAGAAAVIVIAAVLVGRTLLGPGDAPGGRDDIAPTIQQPAIAAVPKPQPQDVEQTRVRSVRLQADPRLVRRLADDVAAVPTEEEPLIPPIAVEPLETVQIAVGGPIAVQSSGVMPIEIEPLQLEPLRGIE